MLPPALLLASALIVGLPADGDAPGDGPAPRRVEAREGSLEDTGFSSRRALAWEPRPGGFAAEVRALLAGEHGGRLGDLVRETTAIRGDADAVDRLLARRLRGWDGLGRGERALVEQLVREAGLLDDDWEPDADDARDAIAQGPERALESSGVGRPEREVFQAAGLIRADLGTIKRAENDHREATRMIGVVYERVDLVPGSFLRGEDDGIGPFVGLQFTFVMDVPWPFGTVGARVHSLSRLDAHGHLVTDVYAVGEDVHWFEGRDVFLPVRDSDGAFVATVVVRSLGFDMAGLPDFEFAQRHAVTAGLGNLKRMAERLARSEAEQAASDDPADARVPVASGAVPEFAVTVGDG